ncbi:MAG: hypothetical protein Q8O03_05805 [Nanoarchaeota archaeon]|nr:hypothetical protein [Nanoarchaeota archaeon]
MVKKTKILMAVGIYLATMYGFNAAFCMSQAQRYSRQKEKTSAYMEYKQIIPEINYHQKPLQEYKSFLSEDGKKYLEKKVQALTEKKSALEKKIKPYDENKKKWVNRAKNPLNYIK